MRKTLDLVLEMSGEERVIAVGGLLLVVSCLVMGYTYPY